MIIYKGGPPPPMCIFAHAASNSTFQKKTPKQNNSKTFFVPSKKVSQVLWKELKHKKNPKIQKDKFGMNVFMLFLKVKNFELK